MHQIAGSIVVSDPLCVCVQACIPLYLVPGQLAMEVVLGTREVNHTAHFIAKSWSLV